MAEQAQTCLELSPWDLYSKLTGLQDKELSQEFQQLKLRMDHYAARLSDAADERRMESWLPATPATEGKSGGSADREAALIQVGLFCSV